MKRECLQLKMPFKRRKTLDEILENAWVTPCGCYLWLGATSGEPKEGKRGRNYPRISYGGFTHATHRLTYVLAGGKLLPGQEVDHKCKNTLCIRPDHLEAVSGKENIKRRDDRKYKYIDSLMEA